MKKILCLVYSAKDWFGYCKLNLFLPDV